MFEYIRLHNFKSFEDVTVNLLDKQGNTKNLIIFFGANGCGKSSLISAFSFLEKSLHSASDAVCTVMALCSKGTDKFPQLPGIAALIREHKNLFYKGPMRLEFGFRLDGSSGRYLLETDDSRIIHEKLEYVLLKNKGLYFDVTPESFYLNIKAFNDKEHNARLTINTRMLGGQHSFMSILINEVKNGDADYTPDKFYSENLLRILDFFSKLTCCGNRSYDTRRPYDTSRPYSNAYHRSTAMLSQPDEGSVSAENAALIDHTEKMLNRIVPSLFPGIKAVRYGRDTVLPGIISYRLMILKDISGTEHEVPLSYASDGMKNLLRQLPYICSSITGDSSAIDNFAIGLHDVTATKLIEAVYDALASEDSTGQLILATHCTALMEAALPRESLFTITDTKAGDGTGTEAGKEINCITRYDPKIHRDANVRKQYLEGRFKGLADIHISGSDLL